MNTFRGKMKDAQPKWVKGYPKVSGLYICACFDDTDRDVLSRLSVADSHTTIEGEEGTRVMDNLYIFDADVVGTKQNPWQHMSGLYDGAITHYLDFDVTY